ncbi:MAG: RCC1 domain-containing protein [Polyangiales bacterium]
MRRRPRQRGREARIDRETACGACGVRCAANETCVGQRCSATPRNAVTEVSLGGRYACALHADGGVSCWGSATAEKPRRMAVRNAVKLPRGPSSPAPSPAPTS